MSEEKTIGFEGIDWNNEDQRLGAWDLVDVVREFCVSALRHVEEAMERMENGADEQTQRDDFREGRLNRALLMAQIEWFTSRPEDLDFEFWDWVDTTPAAHQTYSDGFMNWPTEKSYLMMLREHLNHMDTHLIESNRRHMNGASDESNARDHRVYQRMVAAFAQILAFADRNNPIWPDNM